VVKKGEAREQQQQREGFDQVSFGRSLSRERDDRSVVVKLPLALAGAPPRKKPHTVLPKPLPVLPPFLVREKGPSSTMLHCDLCACDVGSNSCSRVIHVNGKLHQNLLAALGASAIAQARKRAEQDAITHDGLYPPLPPPSPAKKPRTPSCMCPHPTDADWLWCTPCTWRVEPTKRAIEEHMQSKAHHQAMQTARSDVPPAYRPPPDAVKQEMMDRVAAAGDHRGSGGYAATRHGFQDRVSVKQELLSPQRNGHRALSYPVLASSASGTSAHVPARIANGVHAAAAAVPALTASTVPDAAAPSAPALPAAAAASDPDCAPDPDYDDAQNAQLSANAEEEPAQSADAAEEQHAADNNSPTD